MRFKEFYLKEIFSSWVYSVNNPYDAIYDFYALSMINPGQIRDESLAFSMSEAKKKIIAYMQKFLLEQMERAVAAEISHYTQFKKPEALEGYTPKFLKSNLLKEFYKNYVAEFSKDKSGKTLRDGTGKLLMRTEHLSNDRGYTEIYNQTKEFMKKHNYDVADLFMFGKEAFRDLTGWRSDLFGGKAWADIADSGLQILDLPNIKDENKQMAILDHAFDLEHNTGSVFTKSNDLDTYKIKGILDDKRDIKNEMGYYNRVSPGLKGPYAAAIHAITGKTVESEQPTVDLEDMLADVKRDPTSIRNLKNPPRNVQQAAIDQDPTVVSHIDHPDVDIMKQALEQDPTLFKYLKPEDKNRLPKDWVEELYGDFTPTSEPAEKNDFVEV